MLRLSLRAFIALCAAMAVYVALLNWRGQRSKADLDLKKLDEINQTLKAPQKLKRVELPPIGEIADIEVLANTQLFKSSLIYWIRENQEAALSWALSLESNEKKSLVFREFLPIWMKEFPSQCSSWLLDNQSQIFIEDGILPAVKQRALFSPYSCLKLALQLKRRDLREQSLTIIFSIWADKKPAQAVSNLEELQSLPEYEVLNFQVLSKWSKEDFEQAYSWISDSKLENKDELLNYIFLLNLSSDPVNQLRWIFKNLPPEDRFNYVGELIARSYGKHKKAINKFISSQSSYKKDICYGWIAVFNAGEGKKEYLRDLENIKSKKLKISFTEKCHLEFSKKFPGVLIKAATASDLLKIEVRTRNEIFRNFASHVPEYALSWAQGKVIKDLIKELIFNSQDDSVSAITKNLQLASFFSNEFPLEVSQQPQIEGLYTDSYQVALETYNDFLKVLESIINLSIGEQLKAENNNVLAYRTSVGDDRFRDLYTSLVLMHPNYEFTIHSLEYFKEINDERVRNKVLNFMAWKMDGSKAKDFAEYADVSGFLNYSLVSIILEKWASYDEKKAGEWLHEHQSNTWYIPACADFSRTLMQKSVPEFKSFVYGIDEEKRNLFVNKLTIVLSDSSPELLSILPGSINIKKYLQTSKKEN